MLLSWILGSTLLVTFISLVGIFALILKEKLLRQILFCLVGFSAGALIGSAFLHILPEALSERQNNIAIFYLVILGIVLFFSLERFLYWRHCHNGVCDTHAFTYLNLIGDGFHNFIDGIVIAASFLVSLKLGLVTTLAIIFHEIPQELGDFAVLVYGGFTKQKALGYNFISGLTALVGAVSGYLLSDSVRGFSGFILPLTAGGFIYIAASDLIPEIHKESNFRRSLYAFIAFLVGILFTASARTLKL